MISSQRRKQRRAYFSAPQHLRRKSLSSHLSEELRTKYGIRALPIREGDTALVLRGDYAGVEGKVAEVNLFDRWVKIDGATREKVDGSRIRVPIRTSKIAIIKLNLQDKARKLLVERRGLHVKEEVAEEETKKAEEPSAEPSKDEKAAEETAPEEAVEEKRPKPRRSRRREAQNTEGHTEKE